MRIWTIEELRQAARLEIEYLGGGGVFRRITWREYFKHMPAGLDAIEGEPPEARTARIEEWGKLHADAIAEAQAQLVALASVEPKLTVDDARALADECADVAAAIVAASFPPKPTPEAVSTTP